MKLIHVMGMLALGTASLASWAGPGQELLNKQCIACHAVTKPDNTSLQRLWERKGPDLYFAGSKFNRAWMENWLQNPTVIRSGGVLYSKVVKGGGAGAPDVIDTAQLSAHPKLSKEEASQAAEALMALKGPDGLIEKGAFKNEPVNPSFVTMLFSKLRGCTSCHSAKPDAGVASGPELFTAGDRLQPDYMLAYIKDPQAFDAHVWMPKLDLNPADLQKLTGYMLTLKSAEKK
ncbi:Putative cytochrome c, class I [Herminiimonas arsenicoxydans]|uniref:Cytochrome c, class I n=1 Tax=Herminiimonas arsenicoxydans TaxID=204773 RepID=A4GA17_HERAR|nr:Putative cytochrome c, class I [Herminiimonas arsenicoxydans]